MDEKVKKSLSVSAVIKKMLPPSFPAEILRFSLLAAILFACGLGGLAAYYLSGAPSRQSSWLPPRYEMRAADVGAVDALLPGILWCSAPQGAAAALALLLKGGRGRRRALAFVALAAALANLCMYTRIIGFAFVNVPGDLFLTLETAAVVVAAVMELLGLLALLLGAEVGE